MSGEVPQFKNCCFCFPLRAGLLTWGYFKMIADVLITLPLLFFACHFITMILMFHDIEYFIFGVLTLITIIAIIANFMASFVFVIGCHQKKVKWIRAFYVYSIWELKLTTVLIVVTVGITIIYWRSANTRANLVIFTIFLVILVLHAYFVLLLKSEVIKLNASFEISFVNNSVEAEYAMPCKETETAIEYV